LKATRRKNYLLDWAGGAGKVTNLFEQLTSCRLAKSEINKAAAATAETTPLVAANWLSQLVQPTLHQPQSSSSSTTEIGERTNIARPDTSKLRPEQAITLAEIRRPFFTSAKQSNVWFESNRRSSSSSSSSSSKSPGARVPFARPPVLPPPPLFPARLNCPTDHFVSSAVRAAERLNSHLTFYYKKGITSRYVRDNLA